LANKLIHRLDLAKLKVGQTVTMLPEPCGAVIINKHQIIAFRHVSIEIFNDNNFARMQFYM
jgi:hypothetical protein